MALELKAPEDSRFDPLMPLWPTIIDYRPSPAFRVVQLTPPGSACSIQLIVADTSSRVHNLYLVTDDLEAERTKLISRGVAVGKMRHKNPVEAWAGG